MHRIILVRHGETEANRLRRFAVSDDIPLTETGRAQARELAAHLAKEFRPDRLLSSPYMRARQTGEIVAAALNLTPEILPGIHERDFGCLKGHPYERMGEMMLSDSDYNPSTPWLWTPPLGESLENVRRRAISALESIPAGSHREIVLVCHGAVIQSICAHITGEWRESHVPPNCGYAVIESTPQGWTGPVISGDWESLSTTLS
jgi:2,3-bisphosphoglycerate-dependent phosphoglycerate mutase